jgi:hypothetical protein
MSAIRHDRASGAAPAIQVCAASWVVPSGSFAAQSGDFGRGLSAEGRRPVNRWAPTARRDRLLSRRARTLTVSACEMVTGCRRIAAWACGSCVTPRRRCGPRSPAENGWTCGPGTPTVTTPRGGSRGGGVVRCAPRRSLPCCWVISTYGPPRLRGVRRVIRSTAGASRKCDPVSGLRAPQRALPAGAGHRALRWWCQ